MAEFLNKTFVAANGTLVTTHDASWTLANTGLWAGIPTINSNRVFCPTGVRGGAWNSATPPSADYEAFAQIRRQTGSGEGEIFVCARWHETGSGGPQCYAIEYNHFNYLRLIRIYEGYIYPLTESVAVPTIPANTLFKLRLRVQGTVVSVLFNDETTVFLSYNDTNPPPLDTAGSVAFGTSFTGTTSFAAIEGVGGQTIPDAGPTVLNPPLTTNTQTFYSPTVTRLPSGTVLQPTKWDNSQTFYGPSVSRMPDGARGQWIVDNTGPQGGGYAGLMYNDVQLPGDANKWFSYVITTPPASGTLSNNPDGTFTYVGPTPATMYYQLYVDNVAVGGPTLVTLYTQVEPQNVFPPKWNNTQTFYGSTVTLGTVTLSPPRINNAQTFFSPSVVPEGGLALSPPLIENEQEFYPFYVGATGAIVLQPTVLTNFNLVFTPRVKRAGDAPSSGEEPSQKIGLRIGIGL